MEENTAGKGGKDEGGDGEGNYCFIQGGIFAR